jgi:hypothetical protein
MNWGSHIKERRVGIEEALVVKTLRLGGTISRFLLIMPSAPVTIPKKEKNDAKTITWPYTVQWEEKQVE